MQLHIQTKTKDNRRWWVMRGYHKIRLVMVLSDESQTLGNQLTFHFLTTNDDLHLGLQVQNATICLRAMRRFIMLWLSPDVSRHFSQGRRTATPYPQRVKAFWDVGCRPWLFQSITNIWWNSDVVSVLLKVEFCCISGSPVEKKRK